MACDPEVAETIETLTERLLTSTLLDDRRDACRSIKALAKTYRVEVGAQAMEALLGTMKTDRHDTEILLYCLDSLNYVISGELCDMGPAATWPDVEAEPVTGNQSHLQPTSSTGASGSNQSTRMGTKGGNKSVKHDPSRELAEIFLKRNENVLTILDAINENDSNVRWGAIRLLCGLCRQKLSVVQAAILSFPLGVSRLTSLLDEELEVLRNDGLALFVKLTQSNQDIQNLLVYENGFYKLMNIIQQEEYLNGTVAVVMDVLAILFNSLQLNQSNRLLFYEHLGALIPFFDGVNEIQWTEHKTACIISKELLMKYDLMDKLCQMVSGKALPISILSETLNTASDIVRGQNPTMMVQASSMMPILLLSMVKDICNEQERKLSELYSYVNSIYHYITNNTNSGGGGGNNNTASATATTVANTTPASNSVDPNNGGTPGVVNTQYQQHQQQDQYQLYHQQQHENQYQSDGLGNG